MIALPAFRPRAAAFLTTVGAEGPHAVPVSAPVRADDRTILLSLHIFRDSLARLRARPQVALVVLAEEDVAFTARGTARIVAEPMPGAPDYAAVEITVTAIDDHRPATGPTESGADRHWINEYERQALVGRVATLRQLAATRQRCRVAAAGSADPADQADHSDHAEQTDNAEQTDDADPGTPDG